QTTKNVHPGQSRHGEVDQQYVRLQIVDETEDFVAGSRFADEHEVHLSAEEFAQAVAKDWMIVRHQNANRLGLSRLSTQRGLERRGASQAKSSRPGRAFDVRVRLRSTARIAFFPFLPRSHWRIPDVLGPIPGA